MLQIKTSTNQVGCAEQMSRLSPKTATSTTMGDRLIVRVPRHQAVFDRRDADHKNNNRKDNARQSFSD